MRVAFYAPMKPPDHPVPSGDRRMARAFMALLRDLGHEVELASTFRSFDRDGDAARQARLERLGAKLAARYLRASDDRPPDLWFTYHLYHKAPDWLGPAVSQALRIPYVVAEASLAGKQAGGRWAVGYAASRTAIGQADLVLAMTGQDLPGLRAAGPGRAAAAVPAVPGRGPVRFRDAPRLRPEIPTLLAVAMMRADVKCLSYRILAEAVGMLIDLPWRLVLVGDGEARPAVEAMFAPFGERVAFVGAHAALGAWQGSTPPPICMSGRPATRPTAWPCWRRRRRACRWSPAAKAAWPTWSRTGPPGCWSSRAAPAAFAAAVRSLLLDPARRRAMGAAAQARVLARHDLGPARARLAAALADLRMPACASA